MEKLTICPSLLSGNFVAPPSKSVLHRAILCAALAKGKSEIYNIVLSKDIEATLAGIQALGARYEMMDNQLVINGGLLQQDFCKINANESGSTLRFMMPLSLMFCKTVQFTGSKRLFERCYTPYFHIFDEKRIAYQTQENSITLSGRLPSGIYRLPGDISSQFVTGLLFALAQADGSSEIIITTPLESKGYVDLTIQCLADFGILIENSGYQHFRIFGKKPFIAHSFEVEGDYSQAAFFLVASAIGNAVSCSELNLNSLQGDKEILAILKKCGVQLNCSINQRIEACKRKLYGVTVDVSQIPDLVPILAVLFCFCKGESRIKNAKRLRLKESDRLSAITAELNKLGADIKEQEDGLIIHGVKRLHGGIVNAHNDHRIAMALAIAATRCDNKIELLGSDSVKKSMPSFWKEYQKLGGSFIE